MSNFDVSSVLDGAGQNPQVIETVGAPEQLRTGRDARTRAEVYILSNANGQPQYISKNKVNLNFWVSKMP